ncbi:MAG: cell wall-binding repeat-containing protein [Actinobacteria bacterium]|nr:cell wall-binding repeat-containing protein [Actinomycetota bacterium]
MVLSLVLVVGTVPSLAFASEEVRDTTYSVSTVNHTVTFVDDTDTLLGSVDVPEGSTLSEVLGATLPPVPEVEGMLGTWVPEAGFAVDTPVTDSFTIKAAYTECTDTDSGQNDLVTASELDACTITDISGDNRFSTAANAALVAYPLGASGVIVATAYDFPDALAASSLAGLLGYPILLTGADVLDPATSAAIKTLNATQAIIIGGEGVISDSVALELGSLVGSSNVVRCSGTDRFASAAAVYEYGSKHGGWSTTAIVATGYGYADALSISPYAAKTHAPIFLTQLDGSLSDSDKTTLGNFTNIIIVGGTGVVSSQTESYLKSKLGTGFVKRLGGENRYATSLLIAKYFTQTSELSWDGAAFSTGVNYPDALVGGALQGKKGSVLLLADTAASSGLVAVDEFGHHASELSNICILGGAGAVSDDLRTAILNAVFHTAQGLVDFALGKVGTNYYYGSKGAVLTLSYFNLMRSMYPSVTYDWESSKIGTVCADCSGLISWYTGNERNSSGYKTTAIEIVPISYINANPSAYVGWALWMPGHIGINIGDGNYVAEDGSEFGCRVVPLSENGWTYALKLCDINYE